MISTAPGPSSADRAFLENGQTRYILCRYTNEGGVQENLDILPHVTEEAYLEENPAARPARAFLIMCGEGDLSGIAELLQTVEEDHQEVEQAIPPAQLLRYQDPIDEMNSGLHVALEKGQQEIVWLLLWLASDLPDEQFPLEAVCAANRICAVRPSGTGEIDIRSLRNSRGQNAKERARVIGGHWNTLIDMGIFSK